MPYGVNATVSDDTFSRFWHHEKISDKDASNTQEALVMFGLSLAKEGFRPETTVIEKLNVTHWSDKADYTWRIT